MNIGVQKARVGDRVSAMGLTFTIAGILYQCHGESYGWDIEFKDPNGGYHHWKQESDGGELIRMEEQA